MQSVHLHPLKFTYTPTTQNPMDRTSLVNPKNNNLKLQAPSQCEDEDIFSDIVASLRICTQNRNSKVGSCIHANVLKSGLHTDVFLGNSLLDMYAKCGHVEDAAELFEHMPNRTVVSWTSIISGYCKRGLADEALSLFWQMLTNMQPNEYALAVILQASLQKGDPKLVQVIHCQAIKFGFVIDSFLQNSLIGAYAKFGILVAAENLLDRFCCRDVVSWTSVISGCVYNGMMQKALALFFQMQEDGIVPNEVTLLSILQACSSFNEWHVSGWIHGLIMKMDWCRNGTVVNSLVHMYCINGYFEEGTKIFCDFCFSDEGQYLCPETMATLLQGCGHSGSLELGKEIHGYLIKHGFFPCIVIDNSLMDMYGENGRHDSAFQLFAIMGCKDIVSWNTMIRCLLKNEQSSEALKLLSEIHTIGKRYGILPDFITVLASIQACSKLASLRFGQVIHGYITRAGLVCDIFVQNSLIDMYAKSGKLDFAEKIFAEMPVRDLASWNSMIAAYGINGNGISALKIFTELKTRVVYQPNAITFVNVLSACAHAGLVEEGSEIFRCMQRDTGIEPGMEHFACIVDLLGRSGRLEEAKAFIEKMPIKPSPDVWGALLWACGLFDNVEIAETAAEKLSVLELKSNAWRVAISNIYASVGRWKDAAKVRAEMRGSDELRKEGGWSSVEVKGDMFTFMVADTSHPESKMIYKVVNAIQEHIRDSTMKDDGVDRLQHNIHRSEAARGDNETRAVDECRNPQCKIKLTTGRAYMI